jgi:hypothetical protein
MACLVYYQVFYRGGAVPSRAAVLPPNPESIFIGRTLAHLVAPPHTAASLKRHIIQIEKLAKEQDIDAHSCLFLSISDREPVDGSVFMPIMDNLGPGASPNSALCLLIDADAPSECLELPEKRVPESWKILSQRSAWTVLRITREGKRRLRVLISL